MLYLTKDEAMVKEATYNTQFGVLVEGQVCNMIRYADDKAVVSNTPKGLQQLTDDLKRTTVVKYEDSCEEDKDSMHKP